MATISHPDVVVQNRDIHPAAISKDTAADTKRATILTPLFEFLVVDFKNKKKLSSWGFLCTTSSASCVHHRFFLTHHVASYSCNSVP